MDDIDNVDSLPHGVVAAGWIPFTAVTVLALIFSTLYVLWYRSSKEDEYAPGASAIAILGLCTTLLTLALVPVDVFLISYMKNDNGTFKLWAQDPSVRDSLKDSILYAYYACYSVILTFAFLIIPANFFYHGATSEDEQDEPSVSTKLCRSFKFTLLFLLLFSGLIIAGIFLPFRDSPPSNGTQWQRFEWYLEELEANKGEDLLVFLLNVLNLIGMILLTIYAGYGLSSLPCGMIRGQRTVGTDVDNVETQIEELEKQIKEIKDRFAQGTVPRFEQSQIERLEQQVRLLSRTHRDLNQAARSAVNRCQTILRPFQLILGVIFSMFGFLIFLSLLLTNTDKAIHASALSGYTLHNSSLPNPMDMLLVASQAVFPLDYLLYCTLVLFLLACSMSGLTNIGIRFCWLTVYKIRAWKTPPRGLLLLVNSLIYIILALNVVMFSLIPDYTMFGNQKYVANATDGTNTTVVLRCSDNHFSQEKDQCILSRISLLLFTFHYKAWIFGAAYYWFIWILLATILGGSLFSVYRLRTVPAPEDDEEDLIDEDHNNPFY